MTWWQGALVIAFILLIVVPVSFMFLFLIWATFVELAKEIYWGIKERR